MALTKDLVAASASPIILSLLNRDDSYGYAIIEQVRKTSGGELEWTDGMLYPILHRLEEKDFIRSYWQQAESGHKRKYYQITRAGKKELEKKNRDWSMLYHFLRKLQEDAS